jgi:nucleoside-diphosphate-sugar epimerase
MNHKVFVAGASGAIGQRLLPLLCSAGHKVVGTTRTEQGAETLLALGSEPVMKARAIKWGASDQAPTWI